MAMLRKARKAAKAAADDLMEKRVAEANQAAVKREEQASKGERTVADANADLATKAREIRLVETKAGPRLPKMPRLPAVKKDRPWKDCECGCGGQTHSRFVPGHNGRTRGWIMRIERGVVELKDIPAGEREVVEAAMAKTAKEAKNA